MLYVCRHYDGLLDMYSSPVEGNKLLRIAECADDKYPKKASKGPILGHLCP